MPSNLVSPSSNLPSMSRLELVGSRAHRILKKLPHYLTRDEISSDTEIELRKIALQDEEVILGVYENRPHQAEDMVAVSTHGLYLFKAETWHPIIYSSIKEIQVQNAREKLTASVLLFRLRSGQSAEIPILGGTDRTRDIWSFKRFFDRVIKDVKRWV